LSIFRKSVEKIQVSLKRDGGRGAWMSVCCQCCVVTWRSLRREVSSHKQCMKVQAILTVLKFRF